MEREDLIRFGKLAHFAVKGTVQLVAETNLQIAVELLEDLQRAGFVIKRSRQATIFERRKR